MEAGGELYTLTFHVFRLMITKANFPLLLGRDCLRMANASELWAIATSTLIFGPLNNQSLVTIRSQKIPTAISNEEKSEPESELNVDNAGLLQLTFTMRKNLIDLDPNKNLGPDLY